MKHLLDRAEDKDNLIWPEENYKTIGIIRDMIIVKNEVNPPSPTTPASPTLLWHYGAVLITKKLIIAFMTGKCMRGSPLSLGLIYTVGYQWEVCLWLRLIRCCNGDGNVQVQAGKT